MKLLAVYFRLTAVIINGQELISHSKQDPFFCGRCHDEAIPEPDWTLWAALYVAAFLLMVNFMWVSSRNCLCCQKITWVSCAVSSIIYGAGKLGSGMSPIHAVHYQILQDLLQSYGRGMKMRARGSYE